MSENLGEIVIEPLGSQVRVIIPRQMIPLLNKWVGRIQQEVGLPIEMQEVGFAMAKALDQKVKATRARRRNPALVKWDQLYELVKADAVKLFHARRNREAGECGLLE